MQADNTRIVGEFTAIGISHQGTSEQILQSLRNRIEKTKIALETGDISSLSKEELVGELLYGVIMSYFQGTHGVARLSAQLANMVHYSLPSLGFFQTELETNFWFGIPQSVRISGFNIDVDFFRSTGVAKNGNSGNWITYLKRFGYFLSGNEHRVLDQLFRPILGNSFEAVSAVKALAAANAAGQRVFTIDQVNRDTVLPQLAIDAGIKAEISNAVSAGKIATVSQTDITMGVWRGVGYIIFDPLTGSGAYKISGGSNGASVKLDFSEENKALGTDLVQGAIGLAGLVLVGIVGLAVGVTLTATVFPLLLALIAGYVLLLLELGFIFNPDLQWEDVKLTAYIIGGIITSTLGYIFSGIAEIIFTAIGIALGVLGLT